MNVQDEDYVAMPQPEDEGQGAAIWVLFLAGPTIWFAYFLLVYGLGEVLCKPLRTDIQVVGLPLVSFLTLAATVLAALGTLAFTAQSYRRWRASRHAATTSPAEDDIIHGHEDVLAMAGVLLGGLFFVAVLFTGAPALVVQPC